MNPLLVGVALGIGCAFLKGCALPPAKQYTPDTQTRCVEQHVWDQTVLGSGQALNACAGTGWYLERRKLDRIDAEANAKLGMGK